MPSPTPLTTRHIHLDFHTSPDIPAVGADFDPKRFADTLAAADVTSINIFARCHHGYLYYPSKVNPERIHPNLKYPKLLIDQINACHDVGIRTPIYTTVQWDQFTSDQHRDWLLLDETGKPYGNGPMEAGFYRRLDVSQPGYVEFLQNHVRELFDLMPVDGLWFDIVVPYFSYARHWLDAMKQNGLDVTNHADRTRYSRSVIDTFQRNMTAFIEKLPQYTPDCTIFYNSGHVGFRHRDGGDAFTHFELESLPGGGWGYMHFPTAQRYARGLGRPTLGMTGKFHSSWGDFHGYKNEASLEFEIFNMLALGAATCIGDQLPPRGVLDKTTYNLIGGVFKQVKAKEPWCLDATAVTDVAVMNPEEFSVSEGVFHDQQKTLGRTDFGVVRMLQELGCQFDLISSDRDFSKYRVIVLPDVIPVDQTLAAKLGKYVDGGGSLILTHRSGLNPAGDGFADDRYGVKLVGEAEFQPDFLRPGQSLRTGLHDTLYVMAQKAMEVKPTTGATVLAETERPYFNRTWEHFCSHQYAPTSGEKVYPSAVRKGSVIYFAHPLFRMYDHEACRWVKRLIGNALNLLAPDRLVSHNGPSSLIVTLNEQPEQSRYVMHLQHYIPERRGDAFDTVEDIIDLHDLKLTVRTPKPIKSARLVPQDQPLKLTAEAKGSSLAIPKLHGHQMVELSY